MTIYGFMTLSIDYSHKTLYNHLKIKGNLLLIVFNTFLYFGNKSYHFYLNVFKSKIQLVKENNLLAVTLRRVISIKEDYYIIIQILFIFNLIIIIKYFH